MRPFEHLPLPPPSEHDPSIGDSDFFYREFVQPMIGDMIRLMATGIHIDQNAVEELRTTVQSVLEDVDKRLSENPIIKSFREHQYKSKYAEYLSEMETKKKPLEHFLKEYKPENMVHRTYLVNLILDTQHYAEYKLERWTVNDVKKLLGLISVPNLRNVIDKIPMPELEDKAMKNLASDKMEIYNKSHYDEKIQAKTFDDIVPKFNPNSHKQKAELLTDFLELQPLSLTKGGAPQWNRANVETIVSINTDIEVTIRDDEAEDDESNANNATYVLDSEDAIDIFKCLIDFSFGAIIKNNFINAFDKFTINDTLHGNVKLFGAKSFRPTSNNPNLLNMPSTGSIYSKPLKKCFTAPEGYLLWTIDFSALEDRVIANLSGDENKLSVFTENIDGHSLGATYYFPDRVKALVGEYTDNKAAARLLKKLVDDGNAEAKAVRQDGKPVTFGLSYGAYPQKVASTIKCPLEEAEAIFNAYHDEMYPDITAMREEAMKTAKKQGYLHLGLGCKLYSDDVDKDTRTLFNALSQYWSILTLISLNELNYRIDRDGMDIHTNATIYDSLYGYVRADADSVKWLNDNLPSIMEKDFMTDQIVHNEANLEISSTNWAEFTELRHNMSLEEIQEIIDEIHS